MTVKTCGADCANGIKTVVRGVLRTDGVQVIVSVKQSQTDCSACRGGGWVYGPIDAYPITEAMEAPEVLECPVCGGTGKKPVRCDQHAAENPNEKSESRAGIPPFERDRDREGARP